MDNKQQSQNRFCRSMEPVDDCGERLKSSALKKNTELILFEDHVVNHTSPSRPNVDDSYPSDCESGISGTGSNDQHDHRLSINGLIRISEGETIHEVIKKKLVSSLSSYGFNVRVESIHRNDLSIVMKRAKLQSFCAYSKATEVKCEGDANLKYAWYGVSKNEINSVLSYGFGLPMNNDGVHGQGLYLSPVDHPIESMRSAVSDENGLRHMLLCRVIMGKMESVCLGSGQCNPSSEEFDSGVDDLACPKKYVVWASRMNTHVLPEYVVSFRTTPVCNDFLRVPQTAAPQLRPRSDWMPFPALIRVLSKFLPSDAIESITRHHSDFKKQKISRHDMIRLVRDIAGDNLLAAIIKSYRGKMINALGKRST